MTNSGELNFERMGVCYIQISLSWNFLFFCDQIGFRKLNERSLCGENCELGLQAFIVIKIRNLMVNYIVRIEFWQNRSLLDSIFIEFNFHSIFIQFSLNLWNWRIILCDSDWVKSNFCRLHLILSLSFHRNIELENG